MQISKISNKRVLEKSKHNYFFTVQRLNNMNKNKNYFKIFKKNKKTRAKNLTDAICRDLLRLEKVYFIPGDYPGL